MQGFVKEKEFYKQAACIAIPISLQSEITIGVSMMDNIMVGAQGETALSAVALTNQFIGIYQIGCMGIGMGASVLTARFWGMKDITSLKKVVTIMFRNLNLSCASENQRRRQCKPMKQIARNHPPIIKYPLRNYLCLLRVNPHQPIRYKQRRRAG